jgi:hypothetical protein
MMRKSELLIVISSSMVRKITTICMRGNGKSATKGGNAAKNARKWQVSMPHYFSEEKDLGFVCIMYLDL